ncbi:MAG: hypothetical protein E7296_07740 [Lachnospiraceae bacterium]|nr:hypothetical protein [Lachnospiraceae bacterium]
MLYFEPEGFEKAYSEYLLGNKSQESQEIYIDPDCTADIREINYYNKLTKFLSKREEDKMSTTQFSFLPPKLSKDTSEEEKKDSRIDEYKILAIDGDKVMYRLTSDQIGFSACERIYLPQNARKYPLSRLMVDTNIEKQKEVAKEIALYVKKTRTLGGALVWPMASTGRRICQYNYRRGICGYIEDRVDLTLLEVKHALEGKYDNGEFKSDVLYDEYVKDKSVMRIWLNRFISKDKNDPFGLFVDYFMLNDFINEGLPIDITTGEKINEKKVQDYVDTFRKNRIGKLQELKYKDLRATLKRLEKMIEKRTYRIEKYLRIEQKQ